MLGFEEGLQVVFDAAFVKKSPLSWIANNRTKPSRPLAECWVLHGSPEWSNAHLEDAVEEVERTLTSVFFDVLAEPIQNPAYAATHRWRFALPVEAYSEGFLRDRDRKVAVCGDWCHEARIEGAFLSGVAAARWIIQFVRRGDSGDSIRKTR
jgi:predicted NAD/FAD-dependent oxidoreductase